MEEITISRECSYLIEVTCENCGKKVIQTRTQYNRAKHHFCSNKCQKAYQHIQAYEMRTCPICNKQFEVRKKYKQTFCSTGCQNKWQKTRVGKLNPKFTQKEMSCDLCGKPMLIKPSKIESTQHHFCSTECRQKWFSEIFSQQDEWKEKSRKRAIKILSDGLITKNTKPQQITNGILDKLKIQYRNEEPFVYYAVDNYLVDYNLIIEVMGDYWHCSPIKFKGPSYDVQRKRIGLDKAKHTYLRDYHGIEVLYLWETDLYYNQELCERLIKEYIYNNGKLNNYHSFNYHIEDDGISLNDSLIIPYSDR